MVAANANVNRDSAGERGGNDADIQFAIGMPGVAAAVAPFADLVEVVDGVVLGQVAGFLQALEQVVALLVHVGPGDVSDLAGGAAQADVLVVDGRANPD